MRRYQNCQRIYLFARRRVPSMFVTSSPHNDPLISTLIFIFNFEMIVKKTIDTA